MRIGSIYNPLSKQLSFYCAIECADGKAPSIDAVEKIYDRIPDRLVGNSYTEYQEWNAKRFTIVWRLKNVSSKTE